AAKLYSRALEAARKLSDISQTELAVLHRALGDSWYRASEFAKASEAYTAARPLFATDALAESEVLFKISRVEEKLGNYAEALRWTDQARTRLQGIDGQEATRQSARSNAWYATLLLYAGRTTDSVEWAERTVAEAEATNDPEALGEMYFVLGGAYGE